MGPKPGPAGGVGRVESGDGPGPGPGRKRNDVHEQSVRWNSLPSKTHASVLADEG